MRPDLLFPLFRPVTTLKGVGPRLGKLIERAAGAKLVDLLWHLPSGLVDRRFRPAVAEAPDGAVCTLLVRIDRHQPPQHPKQPYRVLAADASGFIALAWFNADKAWLERQAPVGARRFVSGRVTHFQGTPQMGHPDYIVPEDRLADIPAVETVYPLSQGLTPRIMQRAVAAALTAAPELPDWLDPAWRQRMGWSGWREALLAAHAPHEEAGLEPAAPARRRLAYDELLANQLALALVRRNMHRLAGRRFAGDGSLRRRALAALPYALTGAQRRAVADIEADLASERRMLRLLQGDVGSGKTVVALLAMLAAVEAGAQAALMAPTELLARQHFETLAPPLAAAGVRADLLTGRDKGKARAAVLGRLAEGETRIVVGTHALFQDDIAFRDLGLAVVDEQHRFGVFQRLGLAGKGKGVDVLVMTATPIPRTLALTAYGDMEVSRLDEKPPGRTPVDTRTMPLGRLSEVVEAIARAVGRGERVYWVCPLVEESEAVDAAAAEERHAALLATFGARVGLLHGRMPGPHKDRTMAAFAGGELDVLVATTVIEVGVNVPEATVMVVEHADRFGLAQLHQLRGRVGRGVRPGTCLLLYAEPLGETARARLRTMRETDDGFLIAEEDLRLRGAGEVLGTRQSGLPEFRLADLAVHADLLAVARDDARLLLERDPELKGARGQAARVLLYLFERDAAVRNLRSG